MPTVYRRGKLEGLNEAISGVGDFVLQKQLQKQQEERQLKQWAEKLKLAQALKQANPSFLDQKRKDFMIEAGAAEPTEADLAPYIDQSQAMATKLGAQNAMPVAGGGFVMPTPGQPNEMPAEFAQPTQDISSQIKGIQPQDLFRGQVAKRMNAYKAMEGKGASQGQIVKLAKDLAEAENPMAGEKEIKAKLPIAQKIFSGQAIDTTSEDVLNEIQEFDSIEEAELAGLPSGTIVYIQGRKAVIE